ncbi:hypothetical protein M501DRAFT_994686 [Patellaria atrata CBS 101060]|uniref:Uncharacterized protein n=1 Tax=Patellaria atrata CBS 101060 TaxID=1346257 RepID=A0A9P4SKS6_9PEZI|nr:hypothetical protein M501DRAFT_994686 [Patellaria atrata CBS 101060]
MRASSSGKAGMDLVLQQHGPRSRPPSLHSHTHPSISASTVRYSTTPKESRTPDRTKSRRSHLLPSTGHPPVIQPIPKMEGMQGHGGVESKLPQ